MAEVEEVDKDGIAGFKEEMRQSVREMNKQWGALANKWGTLVGDLAYPSMPRIIQEFFGKEVRDIMMTRRMKLPDGRVYEYDVIAITDDLVVLNSTKSTLQDEYVDEFIQEIDRFREVFPEYQKYPIVGVLATLSVTEDILVFAEKKGFLVIAIGDELMEVQNHAGLEPKRW